MAMRLARLSMPSRGRADKSLLYFFRYWYIITR